MLLANYVQLLMCLRFCSGGEFGGFAVFQSVSAPPQAPSTQQQPAPFAAFQSVSAPPQAPSTQQPAPFADFGAFQSTPSTGVSQVQLHSVVCDL